MLRMMKPSIDLLYKLKLANGSKSLSDLLRLGGSTVLRLWAKNRITTATNLVEDYVHTISSSIIPP